MLDPAREIAALGHRLRDENGAQPEQVILLSVAAALRGGFIEELMKVVMECTGKEMEKLALRSEIQGYSELLKGE